MKVKWLGHASFLITATDGTRVLLDPYGTGSGLNYAEIGEAAEVVTVSHQHFDHDNAGAVRGNPQVISGAGTHRAGGLEFKGVASHHDTSSGRERGENTVFCFTVDGIRVCHLGDLGHSLSEGQLAEIGEVDVLLTPVGGTYTIDAAGATDLVQRLSPRVVVPMHFKTPKCGLPISGVEEFLQGKQKVTRAGTSELELTRENLPQATQVMVLDHAL